ncbi:MAG: hypothetical protein EHM28_05195 [Spirochaetaceae bacterium]|nr:MAG: hypothetical protein EHM28_05195 [Spirochaetaceae bacterium]
MKKMTLREFAVAQGRVMVRVRQEETHESATIGVCPACWNIPERRAVLLAKLARLSYEPAFKDDCKEGVYRPGKSHAPGCPYSRISSDAWKRFEGKIRKMRS